MSLSVSVEEEEEEGELLPASKVVVAARVAAAAVNLVFLDQCKLLCLVACFQLMCLCAQDPAANGSSKVEESVVPKERAEKLKRRRIVRRVVSWW